MPVVIICSILALFSCSKLDTKGSYSYTLSGNVHLIDYSTVESFDADSSEVNSSKNVRVKTENGQLHIIDEGDGKLLLTFNCLFGDVTVLKASCVDDTITISTDNVKTVGLDMIPSVNPVLNVTGTGKIYKNRIIFELQYSGVFKAGLVEYMVDESHIDCVATRN